MQFPSEPVIIELNPLMKTSVYVPPSVNLNLQNSLNSSRNNKMTDSKTTKCKLPPRYIQSDVMQ